MFANTKTLLKKAQIGNYAVPHFNINNLEIVQGLINAANKLKSPVILAISQGAIKYAGLEYLTEIVKVATKQSTVPIALHLDHGTDLNIIKQCIKLKFSSIMIDASHLPLKKNIQITKKVVKLAHKHNISVEAELGTIGGSEDNIKSKNIKYTNPIQAKDFVKQTNCDFLAIAIGTSHGAYKFIGNAKLNINLLKKIKDQVKVPLVLHGASSCPKSIVNLAQKFGANLKNVKGVPESQIKLAIKNGICKVNTDTDLRISFDAAIRKFLSKNPTIFDPRKILSPARDLVQKTAEEKIKLFGSNNRL